MSPLLSIGQDVLLVVAGLAVRFLLAVLVLAALVAPIVLILALWQRAGAWRERTAGLGRAGTLKWLRDASYAPWHSWVAPAGAGLARMGLDSLAERLLGKVTAIEVAAPGTQLHAGETLARIWSGDRTALLRAPADGLVVAVNDEVQKRPHLVHRDPYGHGWLATVAVAAHSLETLRRGEPARQWLMEEERRLEITCEHALGFAAADGGDLVGPAHDLLPSDRWDTVVRQFLDEPAAETTSAQSRA